MTESDAMFLVAIILSAVLVAALALVGFVIYVRREENEEWRAAFLDWVGAHESSYMESQRMAMSICGHELERRRQELAAQIEIAHAASGQSPRRIPWPEDLEPYPPPTPGVEVDTSGPGLE